MPAFTGLGAPYWDQYARGTIVGLTRGVNKYHVIRATLESLAYQVNDVLEVMKEDAGSDLAVLRVDGGASANNLLLQIQADISNVAVERPECIETTALGAAYLAGLAVGFWESKEAVLESRNVERIFRTQIDDAKRNAMVKGWRAAVGCSRDWIKKIQQKRKVMQWDKKKDVLCMAFLRRRNCSVADRCSMVFVRKNRWNLQSSQIDLVIVGTFSVCSVISCSFFCIYIDVELFALKAFCFCIFLNSCLKVGNCDGCLKNFKCDAADLMVLYSVLNFFYYFWCLGCYSLGCFLDCFYSFFSCRCFLNLLYS